MSLRQSEAMKLSHYAWEEWRTSFLYFALDWAQSFQIRLNGAVILRCVVSGFLDFLMWNGRKEYMQRVVFRFNFPIHLFMIFGPYNRARKNVSQSAETRTCRLGEAVYWLLGVEKLAARRWWISRTISNQTKRCWVKVMRKEDWNEFGLETFLAAEPHIPLRWGHPLFQVVVLEEYLTAVQVCLQKTMLYQVQTVKKNHGTSQPNCMCVGTGLTCNLSNFRRQSRMWRSQSANPSILAANTS